MQAYKVLGTHLKKVWQNTHQEAGNSPLSVIVFFSASVARSAVYEAVHRHPLYGLRELS
jgi:hypothetical protein